MKYFSLLSILLLCVSAYSQEASIDWGPIEKSGSGMFGFDGCIGATSEYYYIFSKGIKGNQIQIYKHDHRLIRTIPLRGTINKKPIEFEQVLETKTRKYGFAFDTDRKSKQKKVMVLDFTKPEKVSQTPISVLSWTYGKSLGDILEASGSRYGLGSDVAGIRLSRDSTKILVTGIGPYGKDKTRFTTYVINVLDENLNEIWTRNLKLPYSENAFQIKDFQLTNKGEVILLGYKWISPQDRKKGTPKYEYVVFKVWEDGSKEFDVKLDGAVPTDAVVFVNDIGDLFVSGFYTKKESKSIGSHGTFLASFTKELVPVRAAKFPFKEEINEILLTAKQARKDKGISRFSISNLITDDEQLTLTFIAEEEYVVASSTTDANGNTRTRVLYHSNDILVPTFDLKTGLQINNTCIEKSFVSNVPFNTSYAFGKSGSRIYLLFNDTKKRKERKEMGKTQGARTRYTDIVELDPNGVVSERYNLFTSREIESEFVPGKSRFIGGGKVLIYGKKRSKRQYGMLSLQ